MIVSIPEHELLDALREGADRLVFRSRFRGEPAVTRVILQPVRRQLGRQIRGIVLDGKGSSAGLGAEVAATLEGYRVRCQLGGLPGLPEVLDAGLAEAPERCPRGHGLPFVTTRWIPGRTLGTTAATRSEREAALRGVLEILRGIHASNVVYGDLKPANVVRNGAAVHLIDLDTLREVADAQFPIQATHRTPDYMAPEQEGGQPLLYLSSDVFTFGLMVYELLDGWRRGAGPPPELPAPWGPIADACLRHLPLDRPRADAILAYLAGQRADLPAWDGRPLRMSTERVGDHTILVEDIAPPQAQVQAQALPPASKPPLPAAPILDKVTRTISRDAVQPPAPEAFTESVIVEPPAPVPAPEPAPAPPPRPHRNTLWMWFVVLLVLLVVGAGLAGVTYVSIQLRQRQAAKDRYAELWQALKEHKTVQAKNTTAVLSKLITDTKAARRLSTSPELEGLYALEEVWHQRWHWRSSRWDAATFTAGEGFVQAAIAEGETPAAMLAKGVLLGGACRKMPSRQAALRLSRCEESLAALDRAADLARGTGMGWFQVEIAWARVMSASTFASYLAEESPSRAQGFREQALGWCRDGAEKLDKAPVNGPEMIESCLEVAGSLREYRQYAVWADWLLNTQGPSASLAVDLIQGVDPACAALDVDVSVPVSLNFSQYSIENLCRYVGMVSLGCADLAEQARCQPDLFRFGRQLCIGNRSSDEIPWEAALAIGSDPVRTSCYWQ